MSVRTYLSWTLGALAAALAAGGCTKKSSSPAGGAPAHQPARASTDSLPRADWPTRIVVFDRRGGPPTTATFTYASDAPCKLPVTLHEHGVVGCPSTIEVIGIDRVARRTEYRYDAEHHLVAEDKNEYAWDGDAVTDSGASYHAFSDPGGANLWLGHDDAMAVFQVKDGHLLARYHFEQEAPDKPIAVGEPAVTLTWSARRLETIETDSTKGYVEYADTAAPHPEETAAREREAKDHDAAALATFTSVPRADWPCTRVATQPDGSAIVDTFSYGAQDSCTIGSDAMISGLVGCPTEYHHEEKPPGGGTPSAWTVTVRYDGPRMIGAQQSFLWRYDGLATPTYDTTFTRTPTGVSMQAEGGSVELAVSAGHPTAMTMTAPSHLTSTLTWKGTRLIGIERAAGANDPDAVSVSFTYDCKPPK